MEACDLGELALRNLLEALLRNSLRKDGDRGGWAEWKENYGTNSKPERVP